MTHSHQTPAGETYEHTHDYDADAHVHDDATAEAPVANAAPAAQQQVVTPAAPPPPVAPAPGEQVNVNTAGGTTTYVTESSPLAPVRRVVGLLFAIVIGLLLIRVLLLLLGANESDGLVRAIYNISDPFVGPFRGVFSMDEVRPTGRSVLDIAALVAIVGWSLIALVVIAILRIPDSTAD
jgi:hypothetical protein